MYIVDLTADQFEDENREVIVEPVETSSWHRSFGKPSLSPCELRPSHRLGEVAAEIADNIESNASQHTAATGEVHECDSVDGVSSASSVRYGCSSQQS
jgi:hypothetical protein